MIPSVLAQQLRQGVEDFLRTTFPVSTPFFEGVLERLFAEDSAIFKGPFLSLQLPFRVGEGGPDFFPDVPLKFKPYLHQEKAFRRLSGTKPRSTIVATGTGSGKTECFLYPILDHCYQHRDKPGIKAILIYPMNALASDQAARLAKTIFNNPKLKDVVTAGLFVGQKTENPIRVMTADSIITDRETQRLNPPDILLTNYKMLDYLLIRPQDAKLWIENLPETLRFVVVDELHTFDGAQGTDLACLLRRMKARLGTPKDYLCCVGTSATLGMKEDQTNLIHYAEQIFGETFDAEAIIAESTLTAAEFLANSPIEHVEVVPPEYSGKLDPQSYDDYPAYLRAQHALWFREAIDSSDWAKKVWRVELAERLKSSLFLRGLLATLDGKTRSFKDIIADLTRATHEMAIGDDIFKERLLNSFLALISEARTWKADSSDQAGNDKKLQKGAATGPFLNVRLQLWLRELRRMVAEVNDPPNLHFADDLTEAQLRNHLPLVHCRECGSMGWAGVKRLHEHQVDTNLRNFYSLFFHNDSKVVFLFPDKDRTEEDALAGETQDLCAGCLRLMNADSAETCVSCGHDKLIRVFRPNSRIVQDEKVVGSHDCPYCNAKNSLTVLGSQAASLTSVLIAQLYSSSFNDDKKLLTFSDSVQDAAHRAGFFAARTYKFNFRTALQKFVLEEGEDKALSEASEVFSDYWAKRMNLKTYVATFLAPQMEWFQDYEYLKGTGHLPPNSTLLDDVNKRISWEICSEYGFNCRIGRTLEKTGSSIAHANKEKLNNLTPQLLETLQNEIGGLRDLDEYSLKRFLLGVITNLKNQGGIIHEGLTEYVKGLGNTYVMNKSLHWMPSLSRRARMPVFLTDRTGTRFNQVVSNFAGSRTWYMDWAERCFFEFDPMIPSETEHLYKMVIKALVNGGLIEEMQAKNHARVWGIKPEALNISSEVLQYRCDSCGHNISAANSEASFWEDSHCLRFRCRGKYSLQSSRTDYYGSLYAKGDVNRIFSAEHTGLLTRDDREALEERFRAPSRNREPWDPNLLSCTPTLEMGIDIGDLSSVILCSTPPTQANYLQRIGRSGRTDGNALNTTVANARPHDLFFFSDPLEMISGNVDTPGVFLNAAAVLERQLTAYCFDKWVATGIAEGLLPNKLGSLLNNLEKPDEGRFPYNLLVFIALNKTDLLHSFVEMFEGTLSDDSRLYLENFIHGDMMHEGSLPWKILNGLESRKKERDSLRKKLRTLSEKIRKKEKNPAKSQNFDEEIAELTVEKQGIQEILKNIKDQNTFNFFTDEGLLPNYAFPEAGVTLRSVIYRKRGEGGQSGDRFKTWTEQYQRSAVSAIEELAPGSVFYAGGRKVKVDQIDVSLSDSTAWRLCDNCSYTELIGVESEKSACPRCGSLLWPDEGRKRHMLRIRQVFATSSDKSSRISDDSDDREPRFFNKRMLVDFNESDIAQAYHIDNEELPFGFDFITKATFREVNFGENQEGVDSFKVAGVQFPGKGFQICRSCGKVQTSNKAIEHSWTCTARDQESSANLIDCIYLYREFVTEAIRILLPETTFSGTERTLHSFVAALQLGLKQYFRGRIDHLQTTVYEEPIPESTYRKKFLVIYDTVPGGTGYLKELMTSQKPLIDVFKKALAVLKGCACINDPSKDGCYKCLFAYRGSYKMSETSRRVATELFTTITESESKIRAIDNLNKIKFTGLIGSELEARFLQLLKDGYGQQETPVQLTKHIVNKKPGYLLNIGEASYYMEPQVHLSAQDNVDVSSSADFVIKPTSAKQKHSKAIAVFLDGYQFHRDRVGHDLAQRMAIVRSGGFFTWSLTWRDVIGHLAPHEEYFVNYLDPKTTPSGEKLNPLLKSANLEKFLKTHTKNNMEWFFGFLWNPDESNWRRYAFFQALTFLTFKREERDGAYRQWLNNVEDHMPGQLRDLFSSFDATNFFGLHEPKDDEIEKPLKLFVITSGDAIKGELFDDLYLCGILNDDTANREKQSFDRVWTGFLRLYNLFQFLPNSFFLTRKSISQNAYDNILPVEKESEIDGSTSDNLEAWKELMDDFPRHRSLLDQWSRASWPIPEASYELLGKDHTVVAQAGFAWEKNRTALLDDNESEHARIFELAGWSVFSLRDALANPSSFSLSEGA